MSVSGNLPPQAYTRDVLMKAFEWLNTQPPSVRERAGTADSLVALYLQAKRRGATADGTPLQWEQPSPASVEAFKADLKNLAEGLRQFDDPHAPPPHFESASAATPAPNTEASFDDGLFGFRPPPVQPPTAPAQNLSPNSASATNLQSGSPVVPPPGVGPAPGVAQPEVATVAAKVTAPFALDPQSQAWILDVQKRLHLSSEGDALRTLLAIGYERLRDLLPRS